MASTISLRHIAKAGTMTKAGVRLIGATYQTSVIKNSAEQGRRIARNANIRPGLVAAISLNVRVDLESKALFANRVRPIIEPAVATSAEAI